MKKNKPFVPVSIILVTYNSSCWLECFFNSLTKQSLLPKEVILIDNNSTDDSVDIATKIYPGLKVLKNKSNLGFSKAYNLGAKTATQKYLLFLNPDIKISQKKFLEIFYHFSISNGLDITGPKILDFLGKDVLGHLYSGSDFLSYPGVSKKLFYIDGCCLLIKSETFKILNGFDESSFMYMEDIDLSWRARIFGFKIGFCTEAKIMHYGGGSSSSTRVSKREVHQVPLFRRYESEKNALRNIIKNYSFIFLLPTLAGFLFLNFLELLFYLLLLKIRPALTIFKALFWNIINIEDTLRYRGFVQKNRKVKDTELVRLMIPGIMKIKAFINIGLPKYV